MKRRICVRSMGLGAGIMLIGLAVGAIVSPPLIAQRNGVFDEITCSKLFVAEKLSTFDASVYNQLEVVNAKSKNTAVVLGSHEEGSEIAVYDKTGKPAFLLSAREGVNTVVVYDNDQNPVIRLSTDESGSFVNVYDKTRKSGALLAATIDASSFVGVRREGKLVWSSP